MSPHRSQRWLAWFGASAPADPVAAAAWALRPAQLARRAAILVSMFGLAAAFTVICRQRARTHPGLGMTGLVFLLMFCFLEISYRSVELFTVQLGWGRELAAAGDPALRAGLLARVDAFSDVVDGIYFPLLLTQLVGSACLLFTVRMERAGDAYLGASMAVNVFRLAGRIAGGHLGMTALNPFNSAWYFPLVTLMLVLLLAYCLRADWADPPPTGRI